jgi:hypothetical protein
MKKLETHDKSRRAFVKKAAYVAPAILTLQAYSAVAKAGSDKTPTAPIAPPPTGAPKPPKTRR